MKYLIIYEQAAFYTNWYDYENHYEQGMIIIDRACDMITYDGENWHEIEDDHL